MSMTRDKKTMLQRAMRGNPVDRVINFFSPVRGAERLKARMFTAMTGQYIGGSTSRRQTSSWATRTGDADSDTLFDLAMTRERSRDALRNNPLALGAINTVVTNVVGTGLKLKPSIDIEALGMTQEEGDDWEINAKREWQLWADSKNCDSTRMQDFDGLQDLALRSALESGDVVASMPFIERDFTPYRLAVQMIEADRLSNPDGKMDTKLLTSGVEKDSNGAPVAYHISNFHPGSFRTMPRTRRWDRLLAFGEETGRQNVIHLFTKLRPGQTRGMPYLAPVIEPLRMLEKYSEAELMAAVISGMFTVFVKTENAEDINQVSDLGDETGATASDKDYKMGSGAIVNLKKDEDISSANPGRPNTAFDPFVMAILRQIGVALEIPFEILIKHFTASYSAARAALLEAWKFFRKRREWMAQNFCQPVYENWMDEAVAIGRITAPGYFTDPIIRKAYLGSMWIGPGRGMIKEKEEAEAALLKVKGGLSYLDKEIAEIHGGDFDMIHRHRKRENDMRVRDGLEEPVGAAVAVAAPTEPPPIDIEDLEDNR